MIDATIALFLALAPPSGACPVPKVAAPAGDSAFARRFAGGTPAFRQLSNSVASGFRRACANGLVDRTGMLGLAASGGAVAVALANAPDANIASITAAPGPQGARQLIIEYPFLASDGTLNIPNDEVVEEAIFCAVRGASEAEQEESGRCLPD